jgi:pimeloyl-ACP methyl ester carboxylesterase
MSIQSKTIMFVTGCFVSYKCWDDWVTFFESKGYTALAPAWPFKEAAPAVLRSQHPHSPIATLRLNTVVNNYIGIAKQLPEKPIIIGHSFGGLMTQILINREYGAAGVAIHSIPPQGVLPIELSFYKAATGSLGLFTSAKKDYLMPFKTWQYAFTNGMPEAVQRVEYDKFVVPESKLLARDGLSSAAKVDFNKSHAPLLFVSSPADNIVPASLNKRNFKRYKQNNGSVTEYLEVPGRNHHILGLPTWKEDAQQVLNWIQKQ